MESNLSDVVYEIQLDMYNPNTLPIFIDCEICKTVRLEWFKYSITKDKMNEMFDIIENVINNAFKKE